VPPNVPNDELNHPAAALGSHIHHSDYSTFFTPQYNVCNTIENFLPMSWSPCLLNSHWDSKILSSYDVLVSSRRWRHHHERALVFILLIYFLFQKLPLSLKLRLQCRSPPTIDQLYNHGTTAFPKRSETKNPRMEHNNFWAGTKSFWGSE